MSQNSTPIGVAAQHPKRTLRNGPTSGKESFVAWPAGGGDSSVAVTSVVLISTDERLASPE
jgi:hypothetical protein